MNARLDVRRSLTRVLETTRIPALLFAPLVRSKRAIRLLSRRHLWPRPHHFDRMRPSDFEALLKSTGFDAMVAMGLTEAAEGARKPDPAPRVRARESHAEAGPAHVA